MIEQVEFQMNKKNVLVGLIMGLMIAIFFGLRSAILYGKGAVNLTNFILAFLASIMIYIPFLVSVIVLFNIISTKASSDESSEDEDKKI